jgi:hypothetical protein
MIVQYKNLVLNQFVCLQFAHIFLTLNPLGILDVVVNEELDLSMIMITMELNREGS